MAKLTDREVAILRVFVDGKEAVGRGLYAGRIGSLAGFRYSLRIDAGTTRTLDSMERKGFVRGAYDRVVYLGDPSDRSLMISPTARRWQITDAGRAALGEYAFGES